MTKEETLALCTNEAEKAAVERMATAAQRLGNAPVWEKEGTTEALVLSTIDASVKSYNKKAERRENEAAVALAVNKALQHKITYAQIIAAIENLYKEALRRQLETKIASLQAELQAL